ncbi:MAG: hypothetical protein JNK63_03850 [Chthonomonas sp.]|nr:hypothetical protein [Chthonomonas sp.]
MLKSILFSAAFAASMLPAQSNQAYFAILAETKAGRMAGMPVMDFGDLPPGIKLPPEAMMYSGKAARVLNIRLWSPSIAPKDAAASVAPPSGLKQGAKLDLNLYRAEAGKTEPNPRDFDPDKDPEKFTIKIYWGSSTTVRAGQPRVITWNGLTEEQRRAMKDQAREAQAGQSSYYYKDGWTTAYWPTPKQPGQIDSSASLVGKYSLSTNYTGNVDIEAPSNVNFLDPIAITAPNLENKIDLKKAISFAWKQIPNAIGLQASAFGMEGKNTVIIWSSSEKFEEGGMMNNWGFMQMAEVRAKVTETVFMAGTATNVDIPAGIFANADMAMMQMAGYGPGAALEKAQPLPRIQTKTSLQVMLGGKKMR